MLEIGLGRWQYLIAQLEGQTSHLEGKKHLSVVKFPEQGRKVQVSSSARAEREILDYVMASISVTSKVKREKIFTTISIKSFVQPM